MQYHNLKLPNQMKTFALTLIGHLERINSISQKSNAIPILSYLHLLPPTPKSFALGGSGFGPSSGMSPLGQMQGSVHLQEH